MIVTVSRAMQHSFPIRLRGDNLNRAEEIGESANIRSRCSTRQYGIVATVLKNKPFLRND